MQIGGDAAFKLMVPLLAGYIAYSIADRPGLNIQIANDCGQTLRTQAEDGIRDC